MRIQAHIVTLSIRITKPFIQQVTPSSLFLNNCQISSFFISKSAKYRQKSPRKSNFWRHKNSSTDVAWPCFAHFLRISFLTFRFMVTIMSMCFMSFWLLIAHFHCPITSFAVGHSGFICFHVFTDSSHSTFLLYYQCNFFTPCLYSSGMKICYTFYVAPSNLATERRCFYFGDTH